MDSRAARLRGCPRYRTRRLRKCTLRRPRVTTTPSSQITSWASAGPALSLSPLKASGAQRVLPRAISIMSRQACRSLRGFWAAAVAASAHLAAELFKSLAGVDLVHIPYKGAAPALTDLVAGQVQIMFTGVSATLPYIRGGKLKALGVTGEKRVGVLPDVPSISEAVAGYEVTTWYGVFAAAKTSPAIVNLLYRTLSDALAGNDTRQRLSALGADAAGLAPEKFTPLIKQEIIKWAKVVRDAGIRPE